MFFGSHSLSPKTSSFQMSDQLCCSLVIFVRSLRSPAFFIVLLLLLFFIGLFSHFCLDPCGNSSIACQFDGTAVKNRGKELRISRIARACVGEWRYMGAEKQKQTLRRKNTTKTTRDERTNASVCRLVLHPETKRFRSC